MAGRPWVLRLPAWPMRLESTFGARRICREQEWSERNLAERAFLAVLEIGGEGGIRTHVPFRTRRFRGAPVTTTSVPLQAGRRTLILPCSPAARKVRLTANSETSRDSP